jgi:hypothetical protein
VVYDFLLLTFSSSFRCLDCGRCFTESTDLLGGMRISLDKAAQVLGMLCEGMSVSATARLSVSCYCMTVIRNGNKSLVTPDRIFAKEACAIHVRSLMLLGMAKNKALKAGHGNQERGAGGYPYSSLPLCLKLGAVVQKHGGRDVMKSVIASDMKMGDTSAGFYQLVASAKCYQIVEGTRELSLTELGHDYFFPQSEGDQRRAYLGFFGAPPVYQATIQRLDGQRLPSAQILANQLHVQTGVPRSWATRAASLFLTTAAELGVVDDGGFLRYEVALHQAGKDGAASRPSGTADLAVSPATLTGTAHSFAPSLTPRLPVTAAMDSKANVWTFSEAGGTVRLETPDPLPWPLWDRLTRYVKMLEPATKTAEAATGALLKSAEELL